MARNELKAKIRLEGDASGADKAIKKTEKGFRGLTRTIKDNAAAIASAAVTVYAFVRSLASLARAAFDSENAIRKVEAAMKTAGDFSEAASADVQAFAKGLQSIGTESDEAILSMIALAKGFVGTTEEAKKLVSAALDFKEIASISFEEAVRRIGRATGGSIEDIAKFDKRILDLTKTELANGEAARLLGEKYKGLNQAMSETAEGGVKKLDNVMQDLKAAFASGALDASNFSGSIGELTTLLEAQVPTAERLGSVLTIMFANVLKGQGTIEAYLNAQLEMNAVLAASAAASDKAATAAAKKGTADQDAGVKARLSKIEQDKLTQALKDQAAAYEVAVDSASLLGEVSSVQLEGEILAITQALLDQKQILGDWTAEYQSKAVKAGEKIALLRERIRSLRDGLGDLKETTRDTSDGVKDFGTSARDATEEVGNLTRANLGLANSLMEVEEQTKRSIGGPSRIGLPLFPGESGPSGGTFTVVGKTIKQLPNGRIVVA